MNDHKFEEAEKLFIHGKSLRQIERELNINRKRVSVYLKQKGYKIDARVGNSGYNKFEVYEIGEKLFQQGIPIKKICKEIRTCPKTFTRWLKSKGYIITPKSVPVNEELEQKKLLEAERLYHQGKTIYEASRIVKISTGIFSDYLRNKGYDTYLKSRKYCVNETIFNQIDSEEKAYWLGFLYADGYVSKGDRYTVELALNYEDFDHLLKFRNFLQSNVPIREKESKIGDKVYKSFCLSIHNKQIHNSLKRLGCTTNKSLNLVFPNNTILPREFIHPFMRGYFDGDGTVYTTEKTIQFELLGTKDFLLEVRQLYNLSNTKFKKNGRAYGTRHGKIRDVYYFFKCIYGDSNIHLGRKYKKVKEFFDKNKTRYAVTMERRVR